MVNLVVFNSFNVIKNLKKPDLVARQKPPFYTTDKVNNLHERALRIVYNDTVTSFENLLIKDKAFTIHHQNI